MTSGPRTTLFTLCLSSPLDSSRSCCIIPGRDRSSVKNGGGSLPAYCYPRISTLSQALQDVYPLSSAPAQHCACLALPLQGQGASCSGLGSSCSSAGDSCSVASADVVRGCQVREVARASSARPGQAPPQASDPAASEASSASSAATSPCRCRACCRRMTRMVEVTGREGAVSCPSTTAAPLRY